MRTSRTWVCSLVLAGCGAAAATSPSEPAHAPSASADNGPRTVPVALHVLLSEGTQPVRCIDVVGVYEIPAVAGGANWQPPIGRGEDFPGEEGQTTALLHASCAATLSALPIVASCVIAREAAVVVPSLGAPEGTRVTMTMTQVWYTPAVLADDGERSECTRYQGRWALGPPE